MGFYFPQKKVVVVNPQKYPNLKFCPAEDSKIIVSNHVSMVDILVSICTTGASFIAKASISDYPIVGICARALRCLFIQRDSKDSRIQILEDLKRRAVESQKNPNMNNLVVFSEGTTTNGEGIVSLKKGAFVLDSPLKLQALKYEGNIHPGFVLIETLPLFICLISNFTNQVV